MKQLQIFDKHSNDLAAVKGQFGKTIVSLCRDRYYFNAEPDDKDEGSLEIKFSDSTYLTFDLASDGESVHANKKALAINQPFEVEEGAYCSWERYYLTDFEPWSNLKGLILKSVDAVIECWKDLNGNESLIGWVLRFENGDFITYWNCGDDSKILFNDLPPTEENIEAKIEILS